MPQALPPAFAGPFSLTTPTPRARVLCLHGYTGSPYEVFPVATALAEDGLACEGVVLPGHEGDPRALDSTSWQDWVRAAEHAFLKLPADKPRILLGSSMGALVSLHLAATHPDAVAALILLAPALRFYPLGELAAMAGQRGVWRVKRSVPKERDGGDVSDEDARRLNPAYKELPLRGIGELGLLQRVVESRLSHVKAPLCVLHGAQDHTIPPIAAEIVARGVSSARVEHHVLRDSWHVIGIDVDRDEVCARSVSFVRKVLG